MLIRLLLILALIPNLSFAQTTTKKTLDEIVAQNKGKVVVLDYWASWCKPCLKEMPAMHSLMKKYQNSEITFVFISLDIDIEKWKKASDKEGIENSTYSYMSSDIIKTDLSRSLYLSSIPRYVIFDKNGNLANANAPRPSTKELEVEIDKYLQTEPENKN
ncbi:redoxin family protein [Flavobacterium sp. Sd200]|uniref:TlpA family protein disulfide reductase n=1 Tax=Flavobacterium sp. Sd200 TaxID=2692211 RepID=UPI0013714F6A|nr:TlpA disulfide reductase family protein [Flavobacterium sp. Sd200]MXN91892.1 redoxin family protein [Flavobacterium sp. Sd200]